LGGRGGRGYCNNQNVGEKEMRTRGGKRKTQDEKDRRVPDDKKNREQTRKNSKGKNGISTGRPGGGFWIRRAKRIRT